MQNTGALIAVGCCLFFNSITCDSKFQDIISTTLGKSNNHADSTVTSESVSRHYEIPRVGNRFTFLQQQSDECAKEINVARKYFSIIKAFGKLLGMPVRNLSKNKEVVQNMEGEFCKPTKPHHCQSEENSLYRTLSGACNNLQNPRWGMALTAHGRFLRPRYDDGVQKPVQSSTSGSPLPSPRLISNAVFSASDRMTVADAHASLIFFAFGQYLDHDLTFTQTSLGKNNKPLDCCHKDASDEECFTIEIPKGDPFFGDKECMDFARSAPVLPNGGCNVEGNVTWHKLAPASLLCGTVAQVSDIAIGILFIFVVEGYREQMNLLSSFIDNGPVYGHTTNLLKKLTNRDGTLKTYCGDLLPGGGDCVKTFSEDYCPLAGDERVNVVPSLGAMHVLFVRVHNHIARILQVETNWSSKRIFEETRKINGALLQHITYSEFLPKLLGDQAMEEYALTTSQTGFFEGYDPTVNPAMKNVVVTAALRFGHSMIPGKLGFTSPFYTTKEEKRLEDTLLDPHMVIRNKGRSLSELTRYLLINPAGRIDKEVEDAVRNKLFTDDEGNSFDLISLNIQRSRDHGLQSYNAWREFCGLSSAKTFSEMSDHSMEMRKNLEGVYESVDDVEVFPGGITETPKPGSLLGPLFTCLLGKQFHDLKFGDRYWYERSELEGFTADQLQAIRRVKLSSLLCTMLGLEDIQEDAFKLTSYGNPIIPCDSIPDLDLSPWIAHLS